MNNPLGDRRPEPQGGAGKSDVQTSCAGAGEPGPAGPEQVDASASISFDSEIACFNAYERAIDDLSRFLGSRPDGSHVRPTNFSGEPLKGGNVNSEEIEEDGVKSEALRRLKVFQLGSKKS